MATSIFGIATSGLSAAQAGLLTTSHNIANVNTAGFSRQQVVQTTPTPNFTGAGFMGSGVSVATVRRSYSEFLELQARDTQSQAAASNELHAQLAAIDDLLADPSAGLAPALNDFFRGVQELSAHPSDAAVRQALLSRSEGLAARFRELDSRLDGLRRTASAQVESLADSVTAMAARIADLNRRITLLNTQGSQAQPANDLLDQRDALLRDLSGEIGVASVEQSDGSLNVYTSGGQALVVGLTSFALTASADPESPQDLGLGVQTGATLLRLRSGDVGGGRLAGLLAFRDTDLAQAREGLGRIALALTADFNAQHQLGQDRSGALGTAFFAAGAPAATARTTNAGSAQLAVAVADVSALAASDYRVQWSGSAWQVTRLSDGDVQSYASLPQTLDGITLSVASGTPTAGDSFRVSPAGAAAAGFTVLVRDTSRIAAAAPIRTAAGSANTGSGAISAGSVNAPPPPNVNLRQTVTLTFTGAGSYDVTGTGTGNPTGLAYSAGSTISFNGWSVTLEGAPAAGDTFTVSSNAGGVSDSRNALQLAALQTRRGLEGGAASYGDAYAQLVGQIGNRAREMQIASEAQSSLADQAQASLQALAGVSLDEEAANLLRYQQAYQASGKALAIATTLFDTLLRLGG